MNEDIFREILPEEYMQRFLVNNIRQDGRSFEEGRNLEISIGLLPNKDSSCMVKIGGSSAICFVKLHLNDKNKDKKLVPNTSDEERLDVAFDSGPTNDGDFSKYDKSSMESYWTTLIEDVILNNYGEIFKSLKIKEDLSWLTLKVVTNQGNINDCLFYAMNFALITTKVPEVLPPSGNDKQYRANYSKTTMLELPRSLIYIPFTYALMGDSIVLYDPNSHEEAVADCVLTILKNPGNGGLIVQKLSGSEISLKKLAMLDEISLKKGKILLEKFEKFLDDSSKTKAQFCL